MVPHGWKKVWRPREFSQNIFTLRQKNYSNEMYSEFFEVASDEILEESVAHISFGVWIFSAEFENLVFLDEPRFYV